MLLVASGQSGIILTKMRDYRRLRLFISGITSLLVLSGLAPAGASSANISKSYHSTGKIDNGSIVSLDAQKTDYIEAANSNNGVRLLGVAVASDDSLLAVDPTAGDVQVATSGNAGVLVSTLNGDIKVGDQIAVSPFSGIGMKSTAGSHIIGLAQTDLNANSEGATTQEVTDKDGKTRTIHVGLIRLTIGIGTDTTNGSGPTLNTLQKIAQSLTGHVVSTARVVVSLVVALVALLTLVTLIYGAIYSSIISIGRNPLAKFAVFRTLGSVLAMAAGTALMAGIIIFFLLR